MKILTNPRSCKSIKMYCFQIYIQNENRPKNRPNFFKNRFFQVLKSIWPVFILKINLKTKHLNWFATTRVCQYFHSWWMYKRFFKKKHYQRALWRHDFNKKYQCSNKILFLSLTSADMQKKVKGMKILFKIAFYNGVC